MSFRVVVGLICCLGLFLCQGAWSTIYGQDDRLEVFEAKDWRVKGWARAVVNFIAVRNIRSNEEGRFEIKSFPFGKTLFLCPGERFFNQNYASACTGFLAASDIVITAGHCAKTASDLKNYSLVFDFQFNFPGDDPYVVEAQDIYQPVSLLHSESNRTDEDRADIAIIKVDRAVTNRTPLNINWVKGMTVGVPVLTIGSPKGLPNKVAARAKVTHVQNYRFYSDLDGFGTNSGSPVINETTGAVEGVYAFGMKDFEDIRDLTNVNYDTHPLGLLLCRKSFQVPQGEGEGERSTLLSSVSERVKRFFVQD